MKKYNSIIILDLEATCEENSKDFKNEIIEIGAVKVVDGRIEDEFCAFVKPKINKNLSEFCKKLTTIKQEDIDNASDFPVVLKDFLDWAGESPLFCSWGYWDKDQFIRECSLHQISSDWIENHISIKHQHGQLSKVRKNGVGLSRALQFEMMKFDGTPHRGIDDAKNIAKIYLKYKEKFILP